MSASKFNRLLIVNNRERKINPDEILYCMADGSYTDIILTDGKTHKVCQNMKYIASLLPANKFFRCHHSYLINIDKITGFDIIGKKLILRGKNIIPISRRKFSDIDCKVKTFSKQKIIS